MSTKRGRPPTPLFIRVLRQLPADRQPDQCWPWQGAKFSTGYGAIGRGGRDGNNLPAHRVVYEMFVGPIPPGLHLDHVKSWGCTRRDCVNPAHLEPVTLAENIRRGDSPAAVANRNGTCLSGRHTMDDAYVKVNGDRQCRPCQLEKGRLRYSKD